MAKNKICQLSKLVVLSSVFLACSAGIAQDTDTPSGGTFWDVLKGAVGDAANEALEDKIEELSGTFDGEITDIRLIERRGRLAIFEVSYHKVKNPEGLQLAGELLRGGAPSDAFARSSTDITGKRGKLRILFEKGNAVADEGWGIETESGPVDTDQVRLTFVRETHPDEPFGQYLFDFRKTWTDSDEPDVLSEQTPDDDSIALADGEQTAKPPVLVRPGMSIKPLVVANQVSLAKPTTASKPAATTPVVPVRVTRIPPIEADKAMGLNQYAAKASWKSAAGKLAFPGSVRDSQGYVRIVSEANLSTGNKAQDLLNTHPEWKPRGFVEGTFPEMKLGNNMHFKTVIGFLQGANESSGVHFLLFIKADGHKNLMFSKYATPRKHENVDIDLSAYAGKTVQLIFHVLTDVGATNRQNYAVWVKPRLDIAR
ncbi:MAG: hypothetical protein JXA04_00215 [Gammaproteobacteria bacterium]|nr:hypothetical protein [Gammaproteobacteria bacterium]